MTLFLSTEVSCGNVFSQFYNRMDETQISSHFKISANYEWSCIWMEFKVHNASFIPGLTALFPTDFIIKAENLCQEAFFFWWIANWNYLIFMDEIFFIYKLLYIFQPFDTKYKDSITWTKDQLTLDRPIICHSSTRLFNNYWNRWAVIGFIREK